MRAEPNDDAEVRLRDVINMIVGIVIAVAPWFNGDDAYTHGAIRLRFVAACVCALSLWIIVHQHDLRAELANAALGIALVTAPFWRGGIDPYRFDMAVAGGIVAVFSVSSAIQIVREKHTAKPRDFANFIGSKPSLN